MAIRIKSRNNESVEQMTLQLCEKEGLTKEISRRNSTRSLGAPSPLHAARSAAPVIQRACAR